MTSADRHITPGAQPDTRQILDISPGAGSKRLGVSSVFLIVYPEGARAEDMIAHRLPADIVPELTTWLRGDRAQPFVHARKDTEVTVSLKWHSTRFRVRSGKHVQCAYLTETDVAQAADYLAQWYPRSRPAPPTLAYLTAKRERALAELAEADALLAELAADVPPASAPRLVGQGGLIADMHLTITSFDRSSATVRVQLPAELDLGDTDAVIEHLNDIRGDWADAFDAVAQVMEYSGPVIEGFEIRT